MNGSPKDREAVQRALMQRARSHAERDREPRQRRWLQHAIALGAALLLVGVIALGLDAFVTAMQKYMETPVEKPTPAAAEPMPAYIVPETVSPPPTADPDPRPSPAPAPETSQASP